MIFARIIIKKSGSLFRAILFNHLDSSLDLISLPLQLTVSFLFFLKLHTQLCAILLSGYQLVKSTVALLFKSSNHTLGLHELISILLSPASQCIHLLGMGICFLFEKSFLLFERVYLLLIFLSVLSVLLGKFVDLLVLLLNKSLKTIVDRDTEDALFLAD